MSSFESLSSLISQFLINVNVDDTKSQEIVSKIVGLITNKSIKLLEVVQALGDYLTADDDLLRPKALLCLAETVKNLGDSSLTGSDIQVLNSFFTSKFDDVKCFKETLIGLCSLVDKENYHPSLIKPVLVGLEENYDNKLFLASTRYQAFEILNRLFVKFSKFISKNLNDLYIKVFIHIANGEKDPRNLLLSFKLNAEITKNLEISQDSDELFDILFCYFPISFKPPKDDPYKITSQDLKDSLRNAISATSLFAKDSYPNLFEKLSSTSPTVKKDTLHTIHSCVENYGFDSLSSSWVELWNGLKFEILHGDQDDDEEKIFPVVLDIFTTISKILSTNEEKFAEFWKTVSDELNPNIKNGVKLKQTCAIYGALASGSTISFNVVTKESLSLLFSEASKDLNIKSQRIQISNIGFFTTAYLKVFGSSVQNTKTSNNSSDNSLLGFKDEILMFLGKSLMSSSKVEVSLRTLAITELTKLTTLVDFLNDEELSLIVQYFTETVLDDENEYVFNSGIGGLIQVSKINSKVLLEITFPKLLSLLPGSEKGTVVINEETKTKEKIFDIIGSITPNKEISDFLIIRFVNKFIEIGSVPTNTNYLYLIATNLKKTLESVQKETQFITDHYLLKSFGQLVEFIISSNMKGYESLNDDAVLDEISDVLTLIIVFSSKKYHQELVNDTLSLFQGQKPLGSKFYIDGDSLNILKSSSKLINLFTKVLSAVDKNVVKLDSSDSFLEKITQFIETAELEDQYTKVGYLELVSLLVNKWGTSSTSEKYLSFESSNPIRIEIFTWITKGVILKIDPLSEKYIDRLIDLLKDDSINTELITKSFEILVIDLSIFAKFKKIQNNNVRLLYKQKFFQIISPKLVESFTKEQNLAIKSRYLISLSFILKHTQREIIVPYLSSFLPLLLQSLDQKDSDVSYASLLTLLSSIEEIPDLVASHLQTLVPKLLKSIHFVKDDEDLKYNNAEVRLMALNCLGALTVNIELPKLVPYQKQILNDLVPVLDDRKRKVRKGAVDTRQAFFELGRSMD